MGKALYRQFRPSSFDEVIGQDHITTTLKNSITNKSVGHAYLLTGPRGVGKTSIARILAYEVNEVPYDENGSHLDIIEIDAASNRRIDEVRELREKVHIAPTSGKFKVYIIDEVHMLTREAFNALLKTLEEPPAHAIFILATTEIHKLPDTIVSRCITFTFRPIEEGRVADHLAHIASSKGLKVSQEALSLLAKHGEGSFRDSISLLDQVKSADKEITLQDVEFALGLAPEKQVQNILNSITSGSALELSENLEQAYISGANEINLSKQISTQLRQSLLTGQYIFSASDTLEVLEGLLSVPSSPKPRTKLEIILLKQLLKNSSQKPEPSKKITPQPSQKLEEPKKEVKAPAKPAPELAPIKPKAEVVAPVESSILWKEALQLLKSENKILFSIASKASAELNDDSLNIYFKDSFGQKQFSQAKNKAILLNILAKLGHSDIAVSMDVAKDDNKAPTNDTSGSNDPLSSISNIFGSPEVLES